MMQRVFLYIGGAGKENNLSMCGWSRFGYVRDQMVGFDLFKVYSDRSNWALSAGPAEKQYNTIPLLNKLLKCNKEVVHQWLWERDEQDRTPLLILCQNYTSLRIANEYEVRLYSFLWFWNCRPWIHYWKIVCIRLCWDEAFEEIIIEGIIVKSFAVFVHLKQNIATTVFHEKQTLL